jgi:hypothetical protein
VPCRIYPDKNTKIVRGVRRFRHLGNENAKRLFDLGAYIAIFPAIAQVIMGGVHGRA